MPKINLLIEKSRLVFREIYFFIPSNTASADIYQSHTADVKHLNRSKNAPRKNYSEYRTPTLNKQKLLHCLHQKVDSIRIAWCSLLRLKSMEGTLKLLDVYSFKEEEYSHKLMWLLISQRSYIRSTPTICRIDNLNNF